MKNNKKNQNKKIAKELIKTLTTNNQAVALKWWREYNTGVFSQENPYYATITTNSKKKEVILNIL